VTACLQPDALHAHMARKLGTGRVPLHGTFELTWRCNFACRHCYLQGCRPGPAELGTAQVLSLLDQVAQAGCLYLTLTGGEPLCRPDFEDILAHAVHLGFAVTVFTNGSRIDERTADFMAAHPPRRVEISLYGDGRESYAAVTGAGCNFDRALAGLDRLLARGVAVRLKALLLRPLVARADGMRALARERGLPLRLDPCVDPALDGGRGPCALRPDPDEAVQVELADPDARALLDRALHGEDRCGPCGAGHQAFHLDPAGRLMRCLMVRTPWYPAPELGFDDAWRRLGEAGRVVLGQAPACRACPDRNLCLMCSGLERLGEQPGPGAHTCRVARARGAVLRRRRDEVAA